MKHSLLQSCAEISGIGPKNLEKLQRLAIHQIYDLLRHLPFRYQDRTRLTAVRDLQHLQTAVVEGQIISSRWMNAKRKIYQCSVDDGSGNLNLKFFHLPGFLQKRLQVNETIRVFGEVKYRQGQWEVIHPSIEFPKAAQSASLAEHFTPCYPSTQGLQQDFWRKTIKQTFSQFSQELAVLEWLSPQQLSKLNLPSLDQALSVLHFPSPEFRCEDLINPDHPARCRLALEEFIAYFLSTEMLKQEQETQTAKVYPQNPLLKQSLMTKLPFELTPAQLRVDQEIQADLNQHRPMLRLLQGDVGAGKTIVCALAALTVLGHGHQVALMAPTDLLSEQHYQNMLNWLQPLGFQVVRLNRNISAKTKKQQLQAIADGEAKLVIGTHALFQDQVQFQHLGLIIIDEQHRFGVAQRLKLLEKAKDAAPHQLFVTATPIPRTLAMTQFSHFDISILDQVPKGRQPIKTAVMSQDKRDQIIDRLQQVMAQGGQIYWVCTRIEEDEEHEQIAVTAVKDYLIGELPQAKIGLVHGKLKPLEKDQIMQGFKQGEFDILVATTVIEVGVDVPNANIMIIENAERLGLAQLHQLRGRVGRGQTAAFCLLLYNQPLSEHGQQRLSIIRESNDGFWLAEQDLKLRGAGDIFGTQQTGFDEFKLGKLPEHLPWLKQAKIIAQNLLTQKSPQISQLLAAWYGEGDRFLKS